MTIEHSQPTYVVETWPKADQTRFWLRFCAQYFPRFIWALLRNKHQEFEANKRWAEPIYQKIFQQVKKESGLTS